MTLFSYYKALINLLFPQHCLTCKTKLHPEYNKPVCQKCWGKIKMASPAVFRFNRFGIRRLYAACDYEGIIRECVHKFKYNGEIGLAKTLGELLCDFAAKNVDFKKIDYIVPVPLHPVKMRQRGYNQAQLLAEVVSQEFKIKLLKVLKRKKYTAAQAGLNKLGRLKNVRKAFSVKETGKIKGKRILLIDDVYTTGATSNACAKLMLNKGAEHVDMLVLARGM